MNIIDIKDPEDKELKFFSGISETELIHFYEPEPGVFISESTGVIISALEAGYEPLSLLIETERFDTEGGAVFDSIEKLWGREKLESIPIYRAPRDIVASLTGYKLVRGLWGAFRRKKGSELLKFLEGKKRVAVLYDVVNPTNVGAIIRSAAALGMEGAVLTHPSVDPLTRRSARVSMGTVFKLPWIKLPKEKPGEEDLPAKLRSLGFKTAAMALNPDSVNVDDPALRSEERLAVFLGTEGYGLPKDIIDSADYRIMIPMHNGVDSLNVAAASAVCFFELLKPSPSGGG